MVIRATNQQRLIVRLEMNSFLQSPQHGYSIPGAEAHLNRSPQCHRLFERRPTLKKSAFHRLRDDPARRPIL